MHPTANAKRTYLLLCVRVPLGAWGGWANGARMGLGVGNGPTWDGLRRVALGFGDWATMSPAGPITQTCDAMPVQHYGTQEGGRTMMAAALWNKSSHHDATWLPEVQKRVELSEERATVVRFSFARIMTIVCAGCAAVVVVMAVLFQPGFSSAHDTASGVLATVERVAFGHRAQNHVLLQEQRRRLRDRR